MAIDSDHLETVAEELAEVVTKRAFGGFTQFESVEILEGVITNLQNWVDTISDEIEQDAESDDETDDEPEDGDED